MFQSAEDFFFGNLLRTGFHHHEALVAAGDDHVEFGRPASRA